MMISRNMGINWCPIFRARLAEAHLAAGDLERARTEIDGTIATCTAGGYLLFEGRAHLAKARILLAEDATAARESIEASLSDAERLFRQTGAAGFSPFVLEERARLAQAQGDEERSRALLEKAREAFRSTAATGHLRRLAK